MLKRDEKTELFGRGGGGGGNRAGEVVCKARTRLVMGGMVGDESRMQLQLQQGLLQKSTSRESENQMYYVSERSRAVKPSLRYIPTCSYCMFNTLHSIILSVRTRVERICQDRPPTLLREPESTGSP